MEANQLKTKIEQLLDENENELNELGFSCSIGDDNELSASLQGSIGALEAVLRLFDKEKEPEYKHWHELEAAITAVFPAADFQEDLSDQIVIYTGLKAIDDPEDPSKMLLVDLPEDEEEDEENRD